MSRWYAVNSSLARRPRDCVGPMVMRLDTGRKQGAAEHVCRDAIRLFATQQRNQRLASGVVTRVCARAGDAAAKAQGAVAIVKKRLTRCRGAESTRLASIVVAHESDAGDRRGRSPKVGLYPPVLEALRPEE